MCGLVEVVECEIMDAALCMLETVSAIQKDTSAYLAQKLPQDDKEAHEVPRVSCEDALRITTTHILGGSAHCRCNDFARGVHQQLSEPFEDLLDDLRVRLLEVGDTELDSDICDASSNLMVALA